MSINGLKLGTGIATQATKGPPKPGESSNGLSKEESVTTSEDTGSNEVENTSTSTAPDSSAPPVATADDGVIRFSSHPILKFKLGRFRFENGLLQLHSQRDAEEFRGVLATLPPSERIRIKELNLSAAEAQVRAVLEANPSASKNTGSETGNRQPSNQVGHGKLEDSGE